MDEVQERSCSTEYVFVLFSPQIIGCHQDIIWKLLLRYRHGRSDLSISDSGFVTVLVCVLLLKNFFQLIFFLRFSTYLFILDLGVVFH